MSSPDSMSSLQQAFLQLRKPLLRFLNRKVGNSFDAEDIVQESFARWASASNEGMSAKNPKQFVFQIAANIAIDHLRYTLRRKDTFVPASSLNGSQQDVLENTPTPHATPVEHAEQRQAISLLEQAIDELPQRQRQVLMMSRFDGMSQQEIASQLGISRRMVVRHLSLALAYCELRMQYACVPNDISGEHLKTKWNR